MKRQNRYLMVILTVLALLATCANSIAQVKTVERKPGAEVIVMTTKGKPTDKEKVVTEGTFKFLGAKFGIGKVVKGAPYSATATTETIQKLSDGNQIIRKNESKVYRDSEGRTRIDQSLATIGKWTAADGPQKRIYINDPVESVSYELNPRNGATKRITVSVVQDRVTWKTDVKQLAAKRKEQFDQKKARMEANLERQKARMEANLRRKTKPNATPEDTARLRAELEERVARMEASLAEQIARSQAALDEQQARLSEITPGRRKTESLGTQSFEGVEAEGTRNTLTIPAGEIGNTLPIEVIDESWYSPELQVLVMTRHLDPRTGETTYRLTNINRAEPDRSLFVVPVRTSVEVRTQRKGPAKKIGSKKPLDR